MADLLKGSSTIRTSVSYDLFNAKTDVVNHQKEASDDDGNNDGSKVVTPTPPFANKSRVATTPPKMSILFNQLADINVGYFGNFGFLNIQRAHCENFDDYPMIFPTKQTNKNKTMAEKELYAFSEIYMLDILIHRII